MPLTSEGDSTVCGNMMEERDSFAIRFKPKRGINLHKSLHDGDRFGETIVCNQQLP